MFRARIFNFAITTIQVLALAGSANALDTVSVQGGSFSPWRGETGTSSTIQYAHQFGQSRHYLGVEFEYRNFEGEVADIKNNDLETYLTRIIYRVDLVLDWVVTPYVGVGFAVGGNFFKNNQVEEGLNRRRVGADFDFNSAAAVDMLGLAGIDVKIPDADWVSLFGEVRFNYTAQFTTFKDRNEESESPRSSYLPRNDKSSYDSAGGVGAHLGIRFHF